MALSDIITRIGADAEAEAQALLADARSRADALRDAATAEAEALVAEAEARAARDGRIEADTLLANARLTARDAALSGRLSLVDEAIAGASAKVAALPAAEYAAFFASRIAAEARGGETVRVAAADRDRLAGLEAAVAALSPGLALVFADEPASVEHGVVLTGSRVRVDLSLDAIVAEQRDALAIAAARELFGEEGA